MVDNLLESVSKFNNQSLDEIIISVDSSNDDTKYKLNEIKQKYDNLFNGNIKLIFNPNYHSFSKTVNNGIKIANLSNDILLLNNDTKALTSFESFVNFINLNRINNNDNKIGIIGAKLLFPNMTIQHSGIVRGKFTTGFRHIYAHENGNITETNYQRKYIAVTGACFYINRELINKIGYFDENYEMSYEDIDYCINAQLNGYEVWYNPDVKMIHYEKKTRQNTTNEYHNNSYFWNKWGSLYEQLDPEIRKEDYVKAGVAITGMLAFIYLTKRKKTT